MRIMRELADDGTSIVFITHKLREVREVADRITVIRRGKVVGEASAGDTEAELAAMMVGRDGRAHRRQGPTQAPATSPWSIDNLNVDRRRRATPVVDDVSFDVHAGEIARGGRRAGQRPDRARRGDHRAAAARGRRARSRSTARSWSAAHGPQRRSSTRRRLRARGPQVDGLVGDFSIAENLVLDQVSSPTYSVSRIAAAVGHQGRLDRRLSTSSTYGRRASGTQPALCRAATSRRS